MLNDYEAIIIFDFSLLLLRESNSCRSFSLLKAIAISFSLLFAIAKWGAIEKSSLLR